MARLRIVPFAVVLGLLAVGGARGKAFNNPDIVTCAYVLTQDGIRPPADLLITGTSHTGRGIDPGYVMDRVKAQTGQAILIERMTLTCPHVPQFQPLIARYLENRPAPKHSYVHLLLMPAVEGEIKISPAEIAELMAAFPDVDLVHPYSLFALPPVLFPEPPRSAT